MAKIIGSALPNIPWQEPPANTRTPFWRYDANPIIGRDGNARSNSVFNSAVVPFKDGFAGVFRCDSLSISMDIFAGFSKDGLHWDIEDTPIHLVGDDPEVTTREYRYDPRVCYMDGKYYVTWCNGYHGPTIGIAWTDDFKTFHQLENAFLPYNRNGVLFPAQDSGALHDDEPPERYRAYPLRRYFCQPERRYDLLGTPPLYDGCCKRR